jgi:transcription initiation factor TFIID subunit TAF12
LVRATAGTAIVAGTAGAVHHHQSKKWAQDDYEQQQMAQQQSDQDDDYYEEAPPAPAAGSDMTAQLQQLADLHSQGVLSDEEFSSAKAKLLAS